MIFRTISQSIYEIDLANQRIRRLHGVKEATGRQGNNEWRQYAEIYPSPLEVGLPAIVIWGDDASLLPDTVVGEGEFPIKMTTTSLIVEIDGASN